jgi:hypothetical protein
LFYASISSFSAGNKRGAIECIHNSKSRHEIGKETGLSLLEYFCQQYVQVGPTSLNTAQENFIKSYAPYSLLC